MGGSPGAQKALISFIPLFVLSLPLGLAWLGGGLREPLFPVLTMAGVGLLNLGLLLLGDQAFPVPGRFGKGWSRLGLVCLLGAAAAGLILILKGRLLVLALGPAGVALGLVYFLAPAGRWLLDPALGAAFLCFGPLLTSGGYYALTGDLSLMSILLGLPSGLLMTAAAWSGAFPGRPAGTGGRAPQPRPGAREAAVKGRRSGPPGRPVQGTLFDLGEEAGSRAGDPDLCRPRIREVMTHLLLSLAAFGCLALLGLRSSLGLLVLTGLAPLPLALSGALALGRDGPRNSLPPAGWRTLQAGAALCLLLGLSLALEGWLRA